MFTTVPPGTACQQHPRCYGAQSCWSSWLLPELGETGRSRQSSEVARGSLRWCLQASWTIEDQRKKKCMQSECCPWLASLSRRQMRPDQHPQILKEAPLNDACGGELSLQPFSVSLAKASPGWLTDRHLLIFQQD